MYDYLLVISYLFISYFAALKAKMSYLLGIAVTLCDSI